MLNYEARFVSEFCRHIPPNTVLFDCGADIGTFAALVCDRDRPRGHINRVVAYEPNPYAFTVLSDNIANLPNGVAFNEAVAEFSGTGTLRYSPDDPKSEHAWFLTPGVGNIKVTTLDDCGFVPASVAIKIDVEGGELAVMRGARKVISNAKHCVIGFEAHPRVCVRTGISADDCISYLRSIRPFRIRVAETGDAEFKTHGDTVLNIVAVAAENTVL